MKRRGELGKLQDGTKISVTPLSGKERGLREDLPELEALQRSAGSMPPAELAERLRAPGEKHINWSDSDHLFPWSTRAPPTRAKIFAVCGASGDHPRAHAHAQRSRRGRPRGRGALTPAR